MTTKDEALKLALEALELEDMACRYEKDPTPEHIAKAIIAIKEALAQPEQEPWPEEPEGHIAGGVHPPQRTWQGLTDEELSEVYNRTEWDTVNGWEYERAIEAKLKEKNT